MGAAPPSAPAIESRGRARSRSRSHTLAPWLRAAAILVLVAAPVAALPGVRTWVAERVTGTARPALPETSAAASADESTTLRFVPAAGEFQVRFTAGSEGSITVDRSQEEEALLVAIGGAPETVVSSSTLEIRNPEPGRYHLRLPHQTTGVWIRTEARAVAVSDRQIDRGMLVELQPR